jgi:hypothetical protein
MQGESRNQRVSSGPRSARPGQVAPQGAGSRRARAALAVFCAAMIAAFAFAGSALAAPTFTVDPTPTASYATAQVSGTIDPGDSGVYYFFQYSKDPDAEGWSYGPQAFQRTLAADSGVDNVSEELTGLRAGTEYKLRLTTLTTDFSTETSSEAPYVMFTTDAAAAPQVSIDPVTTFGTTSAHLSGSIDPEAPEPAPASTNVEAGFKVNWHFECSPECPGLSGDTVAADDTGHVVSADATGLRPGTQYEVTLVGENAGGPVTAGPVSFTTAAVATPGISIDPVTTFTGTTAHLSGTIEPNAPEAAPTSADVEAGYKVNWHFHCEPECPGLSGDTVAADDTGHAVSVDATGLEPNKEYVVTLVGENASGTEVVAGPVDFTTSVVAPAPTTVPAFVLGGGTRVLLGAKINPKNSQTSYWFEYGTDTSYGHTIPAAHPVVGADNEAHFETQQITGLALSTTYHFRVVAEGGGGAPTHGEDLTFTTPSPAPPAEACENEQFRTGPSANLPECRAYELASPPDLRGSSARPPGGDGAGGSVTWSPVAADGDAVIWTTDAVLPGARSTGRTDAYLSRRTTGGWTSRLISPPVNPFSAAPFIAAASPDLQHLIWYVFDTSIDPEDHDPLSPQPGEQQYKDLYRQEPDGSFVWLDRGPPATASHTDALSLYGASDDMSKVFFNMNRVLVSGGQPQGSIYEATGHHLAIASLEEDGNPLQLPILNEAAAVVASSDGSTVAYEDGVDGYLRSVDLDHTVKLFTNPFGGFDAIAGDGSRVIFHTDDAVTADDEDAGADLYVYSRDSGNFERLSAPSGSPAGPGPGDESTCQRRYQSAEAADTCEPRSVAVSEDATRVYFVSPERLDAGKGTDGDPNLYLREGGQTRYVATLDPGDQLATSSAAAELTPDDSKLLFQSKARLSAYDNAEHVEIYSYDSTKGELSCVSCRPSGQPAGGDASLRDAPVSTAAPFEYSANPLDLRNSDEDATLFFFQTSDALVPGDTNGNTDVYEFDLATQTVSLISSGESKSDSTLLGNSLDGEDLFIFANDALAPQERSAGAYKVYDARVGGGFPVTPAPAICEGEACRGQGSTLPSTQQAASSSFAGPGDPAPNYKKPPHKKHHKKHARKHNGKHHKGKHKPKHARQDKRAHGNGRTGR